MLGRKITPGNPSACPTANAPDAPEGVCNGCSGREVCRAAILRAVPVDMKAAQEQALMNSMGSLAWEDVDPDGGR